MRQIFSAALIACAISSAGAASAAQPVKWVYSYGPLYKGEESSYPPLGTAVSQTVTSAPANTNDVIFITRLSNFTVEKIRISNALPGDTVQLGTSVGSVDYLGMIGSDGTFLWNGAVSPTSWAHNITYFHLNVGTFSDDHLVNTRVFQLDELTFSGNIPSPAPEPATWAMLIMGFGITGMALRRRSHALAA